ncbi:hypothetical protein [Ramlibacter sp. PS4R-6]|uniref:hypothetical protein n=1 Tax=Ramlibacter sp. PS4R-6 TaxID=3133438 RepID=UPI0030989E54
MSDQAVAWKATFGALVLLFCAGTYMMRKPAEAPQPAAHAPLAALPAAAPQAPAPLDVQDDTPPVRIEVTLHEADLVPRALLRTPPRKPARHAAPAPKLRASKLAPPRVHVVAAKRKASPYAVGRKHYPYDPKQRWALRDAP